MAGRKKGKKHIFPVTLFLVLIVICGGFAIFYYGFKVKTIKIEGSDRYTYDELYGYLFEGRNDTNTLLFKSSHKKAKEPQIPFIAKAVYTIKWPGEIDVRVYEKNIVGYVEYKGTNMYFDRDGIIVESSTKTLDDIPYVEGLKYNSVVLYGKLDVGNEEIFNKIGDISQYLSKYDMRTDKMIIENGEFVYLVIKDVTVKIGTVDENIGEKIYELSCMASKFDGMKGTLYMDNYDGSNKNIIFKEDTGEKEPDDAKSPEDKVPENPVEEPSIDANEEAQ